MLGMAVTDLLVEQFPKILDLKFTAHMEDKLDDIASAKADMIKVLDEFYYPFQEELKVAETHTERVQIPTSETCHLCTRPWSSSSARPASSWAAPSIRTARRRGP